MQIDNQNVNIKVGVINALQMNLTPVRELKKLVNTK